MCISMACSYHKIFPHKHFPFSHVSMIFIFSVLEKANINEVDKQKPFHFRSLVAQLEVVNPRKMKHAEKLAFWINVHNALVMHVKYYT